MTGRAPRLLTRTAAAAYCSISVEVFNRLKPARPIALQEGHKRLNRFDVHDLDRWIESRKGLEKPNADKILERLGRRNAGQDARH